MKREAFKPKQVARAAEIARERYPAADRIHIRWVPGLFYAEVFKDKVARIVPIRQEEL